MGLLDQLWDETVAGPRPDSGLGRLRNITIARPPSLSVDASPRAESYSSSVPSSPASTPDSPFATATTPKADGWRRFRRKTKVSDGPEPAVGPRSPTVYDWFVLGPRSVSFLEILPPP
ncbi:unnamed protein product [Miscanthus lutarioriparius]|uniref:Uncharacterized protein n=1 Tax=Miscanthus lutarioriparius TaxID=422564 RepID=A0A811PP82_9POAL|nr:unnamed protein product [Miscanthus lutarioriparius]